MKKLIIFLTVLLVLGTSCEDFLGVNEKNPNSASAVPANLLLPAALNSTANIFTNPDNFLFVYVWHGSMAISTSYVQPTSLTQYNLLNSHYQGNWANSYINLQNYDYIDKESVDTKDNYYKAIAKIMKVYVYHNLVDIYGNIPYSQALKTDEGILKPEYDDQKTIYEDLVLQLDAAMDLISDAPGNANEVGAYDIIYQGDMDLWWKFANTIKLRILINQSGMTDRTTYITTALATQPHATTDFLGAGEGAMLNPGYLKSSGKMNPFWENFYKQDDTQQSDGLQYYAPNQDACDFLTANNDPRKFRFFAANPAGIIRGNYFGALLLDPPATLSILGPGLLRAYNQDAPILTDFESLFLQAEAVQRNLLTGSAKALYESAVTQSIIYMGGINGTAAAAATYLTQEAKQLVNFDIAVDKIKTIITQKWCALNGVSPMPIWTDYRRTGFPVITLSQDPARKGNVPPVRLLYPQTEISTNNDNVLAQGTIELTGPKIFWQNR
ncbi:MAG: SusD/RagB family nutrient-binding outer membrane lipoprotein [Bacteroidales bacterium]|nr:SusD/RagB family nutrient-binding outer membrane lipoprotein [Bacteroidales bacterium]